MTGVAQEALGCHMLEREGRNHRRLCRRARGKGQPDCIHLRKKRRHSGGRASRPEWRFFGIEERQAALSVRPLPSKLLGRRGTPTFLLALIWISTSPVGCGPAGRRACAPAGCPRPTMRIRSPFFRCLVIRLTTSVRISSACCPDSSWSSADRTGEVFEGDGRRTGCFLGRVGAPRC